MKIKTLFALSGLLFVFHGLEEYFTGFYQVDNRIKFILDAFHIEDYRQGFLMFQVLFWFLLFLALVLVSKDKFVFSLTVILEVILVYELSHIVDAFKINGYSPGLYTALFFLFPAVYILFKFPRNAGH